ncbi:hypothetical protein P9246_15845 [Aeribacillus pallidus]|uniref:hypothetical protein n=1 Tax=Aeribacillus composti TaxID=1868734 RepID=UPI002E1AAF39|nr:hypothetical protein [Aeribacillus composti]MED4488193.1 hypothetical protein [Aeribacillus pallidus]
MENEKLTTGFVIQPRLQFKNIRDQMIYQYLISEAQFVSNHQLSIGQLTINLSELERETGWTRRMLKKSLDRLSELGYIQIEVMKQKRGILVTISDYESLQKLENYKKNKQKNVQENVQQDEQENVQEEESQNHCGTRGESMSKNQNVQENVQQDEQENVQVNNITAYINSINNINKTLKEYIVDAPVKNKNLSTVEDIETFVDFALRTNSLPHGVNKKILVSYFDCIRLTRQTCTISANILVKFIEKIRKYSVNQIHFALWKHIEQHDDKRESYTLGILRNTNEHEARRGLIKLKNKGGVLEHAAGDENTQYEYPF